MQRSKLSRFAAPAVASLAIAAVLALGACSRTVKPPEPVKIEGSVTAAADINPDRSGRPSPVVLRIYQLRRSDAFQQADFFALFDDETKTLSDALISRQEMNVRPGSTADFPVAVSPEAQYLGVLAAFRDFNDAQWRATVELQKLRTGVVFRKPVRVVVRVEGRTVAVSVHKPSDESES
jgi:type VI secretion system protein VasD